VWILAATARGLKLRAQASLRVVDRGVKRVGGVTLDYGRNAGPLGLARKLGEKFSGVWASGGGSSGGISSGRFGLQVNSLPRGRIGLVVLGIDLEFIGRPRPLELSQSYRYSRSPRPRRKNYMAGKLGNNKLENLPCSPRGQTCCSGEGGGT